MPRDPRKNRILGDRCAICPRCGYGRRYLVGVTMPADDGVPRLRHAARGGVLRVRRDDRVGDAGRLPRLRHAAAARRAVRHRRSGARPSRRPRRSSTTSALGRWRTEDAAALDAVGGALEGVRDLCLVALAAAPETVSVPPRAGDERHVAAPRGRPGRAAPWRHAKPPPGSSSRGPAPCRAAPAASRRGWRRPCRPPWRPASSSPRRRGLRELVAQRAEAARRHDHVPGAAGGLVERRTGRPRRAELRGLRVDLLLGRGDACGRAGRAARTLQNTPATFAGVFAAVASARNAAIGCVTPLQRGRGRRPSRRAARRPPRPRPPGRPSSKPVGELAQQRLRRWASVPCRPPAGEARAGTSAAPVPISRAERLQIGRRRPGSSAAPGGGRATVVAGDRRGLRAARVAAGGEQPGQRERDEARPRRAELGRRPTRRRCRSRLRRSAVPARRTAR